MTTTFADARSALVAAVKTTGLACTGYIQDSKNPPCAEVTAEEFDRRMVLGGGKSTYMFKIRIFDKRGVPDESIARLDAWVQPGGGDNSVVDAVENENNWDGVELDYASVVHIGGDAVIEIVGTQYLTREIDIEVVF